MKSMRQVYIQMFHKNLKHNFEKKIWKESYSMLIILKYGARYELSKKLQLWLYH